MEINNWNNLFPFFVLFYGILVTFTLHNRRLMQLAAKTLPPFLISSLLKHKKLALICLYIAGLWSLQTML